MKISELRIRDLWIRFHRNIPFRNKFIEKKYLREVGEEKIKEFVSAQPVYSQLKKIALERRQRGLSTGLNVGAALAHAAKFLQEKLRTDLELLALVWVNPVAKREFKRALRVYTDEKTYKGRLKPLDEALSKYFSRKFSFADVGCSHGVTTEDTVNAFPKAVVTGYDSFFPPEFSEEGKKAVYKKHDIIRRPLPTKFDCVRCANVLTHFSEDGSRKAFSNFVASVKENGILIVDEKEKHAHNFYRVRGGNLIKLETVYDLDYTPDY